MNRRDVLKLAGLGALLPFPAFAEAADRLAAEVELFAGGRPVLDGGFILDVPDYVESGYTVPVRLAPAATSAPAAAPAGTAPATRLEAVRLFAPANPLIRVASLRLGPSIAGEVSIRIRLARSQTVTALARTADGRVFRIDRPVRVLVGGCGFDLEEPA